MIGAARRVKLCAAAGAAPFHCALAGQPEYDIAIGKRNAGEGRMKLLLTNDDGIDASGLSTLAEGAAGFGDHNDHRCASSKPHSGCSHRVTTQTGIAVVPRGERRFAVDGTPADCVRVALHRRDPEFDWVLAGINAGGNLGADVYLSGTVSAVREAVLHGRPGDAFRALSTQGPGIQLAASGPLGSAPAADPARAALAAGRVLECESAASAAGEC